MLKYSQLVILLIPLANSYVKLEVNFSNFVVTELKFELFKNEKYVKLEVRKILDKENVATFNQFALTV